MLAIIGGTGIYNIEGIKTIKKIAIDTPFGKPSSSIIKANYKDKTILFLPRHGENHQYLPHEINYQANIFALKKLGAKQILGFSAAGSLRENIHPGDFVVPAQYIDFLKSNRKQTFFGDGIAAHISTAIPTCENITSWAKDKAQTMNIKLHTNKTYVCVDGPRLGTKAESNFFRSIGYDVVGMSNVPEVYLAREAQICYATICIITDYDCWMEDEKYHVSVKDVISRYGESINKAKKLLLALLETDIAKIDEDYRKSLTDAILTPYEYLTKDKKDLLAVLTK